MYDTMSRQAVVRGIQEERLAEARRSHLLRAARDEEAFEVERSAVRGGLRSRLAATAGSIRHGLANLGQHPHGAGAH